MCEERVSKIIAWMYDCAERQGGVMEFAYYDDDRMITDEGDTLGPDYQWRNVSIGEWLQVCDELGDGGLDSTIYLETEEHAYWAYMYDNGLATDDQLVEAGVEV